MSDDQRFTVGSGNLYADLGFEEPELEETKAALARQIGALIRERRLTQVQAAQLLGIGVRTLQRKIQEFGLAIPPKRRRPRARRGALLS